MTAYTATYSPDDNKLRLYASSRLDRETYDKVRAAGFIWAPKQELFVAPMWTPSREDLLLELAGEIDDEDTSLAERAEERAERFEDYKEKRLADATAAREAVAAIADNIPFGQPILVGHHSERHARKDAERIETGMRKAIRLWDTSNYWQSRAAGAISHAKHHERPDVRARRIKKIEADKRKVEKETAKALKFTKIWKTVGVGIKATKTDGTPASDRDIALFVAGYDHVTHKGESLWHLLDRDLITPEAARDFALDAHERGNQYRARWIAHYENRLLYERAMLGEQGGIVADQVKPEKGGAVRCWASPGFGKGWAYITRVNKGSVSLMDDYGNGGRPFRRVIPFDKLAAIMTPAQVGEAREAGTLKELANGVGFYLLVGDAKPETREEARDRDTREHQAMMEAERQQDQNAADFERLQDQLKAGVKVEVVSQLFPTPAQIAAQMVELAEIQPGDSVLEPSAGTGAIAAAVAQEVPEASLFMVEIDGRLCQALAQKFTPEGEAICKNVLEADFLECNGNLGTYDKIVMNPPFKDGIDIQHILHAQKMLKPGGRLVALCANGPRQVKALRPIARHWEDLPEGSFKEAGTMVNAALLVIDAPRLSLF